MAPPRRILREQLEILVDFLESNKDMLKGMPLGTPVSQQTVRKKWTTIATKLNAVESGVMKSPKQWKKYWFEWRHRCGSKASDARRYQSSSSGNTSRFMPLDDLEMRVVALRKPGASNQVSSSKHDDNFLADDSDSDPLENIAATSAPIIKTSPSFASCSKLTTEDEHRSMSPPPKWALELEERRVTAAERTALALESIALAIKSQQEHRIVLDERISNAMTAMAGTIQDLNSGIHEALQHLKHLHPIHNGVDAKNEIFY